MSHTLVNPANMGCIKPYSFMQMQMSISTAQPVCLQSMCQTFYPACMPATSACYAHVAYDSRWFDNTLFTIFRGKRCYDGGLTNFIPLPPTQHGVRVCCFPSKQITTIYDIGISPDNYEDWPHTLQEMLSWAFEPANDKLLLEFIGNTARLDVTLYACIMAHHSQYWLQISTFDACLAAPAQ